MVSGPNAKVEDQWVKLTFDASLTGSSVAALSVTDALATQLLQPAEKSLQELQDALDTGQPLPGFLIPHQTVAAAIDIQHEKRTGRNVLARLQANGNERTGMVVVGALWTISGTGWEPDL